MRGNVFLGVIFLLALVGFSSALSVDFVSPLATNYTTGSITVNITNSSDVNMTWWNNGTANLTYTGEVDLNLSDGEYTFIAYVDNATGTENSTSVTFNIDTTAPTFVSISNWSNYDNESVSILINATDAIGIGNYTINDTTNFAFNVTSQNITNATVLSAGVYSINVSVNDSLGNLASEVIIVNVTAVPVVAAEEEEETSTSTSSGYVHLSTTPKEIVIAKSKYLKLKVGTDYHKIHVDEIIDGKVSLRIESTVFESSLSVGESISHDIDSDGIYDIKVTLLSTTSSSVKLRVVAVSSEVIDTLVDDEVVEAPVDEAAGGVIPELEDDQEEGSSNAWFWIFVILALAVLIYRKRRSIFGALK